MNVTELHSALVGIPSLSHEEGPIMDYAQSVVEGCALEGLEIVRHENNLWFGFGAGKDVLLLVTHLDVVPPSENHPFDPFTPTVEDGRVYGRGAVDAKASAAAMTTAVLGLAAEGFRPGGRVLVALTSCEEVGGPYNGLEQLLANSLPPITAALVGEPTEMQPCVAQRGILILHATSRGKTAHAARAHLGENAIYRAARDVLAVEAMTFDRVDPHLGATSAAATVIEGGTSHNVVPDSCRITIDIRSTVAYTHSELVALVRDQLESEVHVHSDRYVSVATDVSERIVQACVAASPRPTPFGSPTASDWIHLKGVPCVKIGPGRSELSHTSDEHIPLDDLTEAVNVYRAIIQTYFSK